MITEIRPIEHFKAMVEAAVRNQKVTASETVEFYLSSLLESFVQRRKLAGEPISTAFLKAFSADRESQLRLLKELGDIALFTSGFFSDSFRRKIIDVDYYIALGSGSYGHLAAAHREEVLASLFSELSERFGVFVDVLGEVSERSRLTSSTDILRVYERWLRTGSRRMEKMLRDMGITPQHVATSLLH